MTSLLLCRLVNVYLLILFARVILSFVPLFRPGWSPPDWLRPIVDFVYVLTDTPINFLRRFIPQPMNFPLDLSFLVWFLIVQYVFRAVFCG